MMLSKQKSGANRCGPAASKGADSWLQLRDPTPSLLTDATHHYRSADRDRASDISKILAKKQLGRRLNGTDFVCKRFGAFLHGERRHARSPREPIAAEQVAPRPSAVVGATFCPAVGGDVT